MTTCPFCEIKLQDNNSLIEESINGLAFFDKYPISDGHALVIPSRHVEDLFDLNSEEISDIWKLVEKVKSILSKKFHPNGFNIGINIGEVSGQTISHAHVHVIPRYKGDVPDPRGGIRWVKPDKAKYW